MTPDYEKTRDDYYAEMDRMSEFLEREGYRRCDIPACNCGWWHRHAEPTLAPGVWTLIDLARLADLLARSRMNLGQLLDEMRAAAEALARSDDRDDDQAKAFNALPYEVRRRATNLAASMRRKRAANRGERAESFDPVDKITLCGTLWRDSVTCSIKRGIPLHNGAHLCHFHMTENDIHGDYHECACGVAWKPR